MSTTASIFMDHYDGQHMTRVFPADDLARLVRDSVEYYQQQADHANEQAGKTREEVKKDTLNQYEAENQRIKKKLERAVAILGSDLEMKRYLSFLSEHEKCLRSSRANWGRAPYVKQVGTGLGTATTVVCQVCGAEQDITDLSGW